MIELLAVISLIVLLSIAVYGNFQSGVSIMNRVAASSPDEEVQIFIEKFSRDVVNSFPYKGVSFEGTAESLRFPTLVRSIPELGGGYGIGRVTYSYDSFHRSISKLSENMSDVYQEKEAEGNPIFRGVQSLSFQYFQYDPAQQIYFWEDSWVEEEGNKTYPIAVKLEMEFIHEGESRRISRTIPLVAWSQAR